MKKAGSSSRTNHRPQLTPELHRFIRHMGGYFENSGVPRIGGLMLGLLMIAHEPLSADDIASILKVSRASVSINYKILASAGLAERFTNPDDRHLAYYVFPDTAWEHMLQMGVRRAEVFKRVVHEGLNALPPRDPSHKRLELADRYTDLLTDFYLRMINDWRQKQAPARASAKEKA